MLLAMCMYAKINSLSDTHIGGKHWSLRFCRPAVQAYCIKSLLLSRSGCNWHASPVRGSAAGKQALVHAQGCQCLDGCEVVVVDVAGLLPQLYKVLEVVFMGDSLAEDARYMAHAAAVHTCLLAAAAAAAAAPAAVCLYILLSTW